MTDVQVAISQDFFMAFAAIPKAQQKKVNRFVSKFRNNPLASGINYEKINDAANEQFRSVRIDQDYRGIVLKPESGKVYLLLWVAKHDDAYDWARRHRCAVNDETGSLQLYEVVHGEPTEQPQPAANRSEEAQPVLQCRERELLRLGVPKERLAQVQAATTAEQLDAMKAQLPLEAYEAISFLASGIPLDEVMAEYAQTDATTFDAQDYAAALDRPQTKRRFHVVQGELELQQMLEAPLEQWRVFLHPAQRRLVERDWNGPVRVLGGAGTGKTVVAMHRARWLVDNVLKPDERLLFTTFTRNLATDIEANLRTICTPGQMKQIEVINIDAWVRRFLKREKQPHNIVYPGDGGFDPCWERALQVADGSLNMPDNFYMEEWERVVLPQRVLTRADYFKASRLGRGIPLARKQRAKIWPVFEEMRFQLHQAGLMTGPDAVFAVQDMLAEGRVARPYRAAVVDEAQDLGGEVMQLIRALVGDEKKNDLMIVGDGHQRIYKRKTSLGRCGINIIGRGRKLRINYRTTEQIRQWAVTVLEGAEFDDLDGDKDSSEGYRSLVDGNPPVLKGFDDPQAEADWVVAEIERLAADQYDLEDICIVSRTKSGYKRVQTKLSETDCDHHILDTNRHDDHRCGGVRLANMHRIKGLEFRVVILVGINKGAVPLEWAMLATDDPVERRAVEANERALLHVAASRAVSGLYVCWSGEPSVFIGHQDAD